MKTNFLYNLGRSAFLATAMALSGLEARAENANLIEYAKYTGNFEGKRARVYFRVTESI